MPDVPNISDAEWRVMRIVWDHAPITGSDVAARLASETDWSPRTVKTMLARLVDKGALTFSEDGNRYLYRPAVSRDACVHDASRSFLDRVFSGDRSSMLAQLVKQSRLNADDIAELKRILDEKG